MIGLALTWPSTARGTIIEQYAAAEAMRHGYRVLVPLLDLDGVDLYIINSRGELVSAQVKTAALDKRNGKTWSCPLTSSSPHVRRDGTRRTDYQRRCEVDVFIAITADFEIVWVVPNAAVPDQKRSVTLRERWRERWTVIDSISAYRVAKFGARASPP